MTPYANLVRKSRGENRETCSNDREVGNDRRGKKRADGAHGTVSRRRRRDVRTMHAFLPARVTACVCFHPLLAFFLLHAVVDPFSFSLVPFVPNDCFRVRRVRYTRVYDGERVGAFLQKPPRV